MQMKWRIVSKDERGRKLFYSISPIWVHYPCFSFERAVADRRLAELKAKNKPHAESAALERDE